MTRAGEQTAETTRKKARYLRAVAQVGTLTAGCRAARVTHTTVYGWRDDPDFAAHELAAREAFSDALEAEAVRRAWHGTLKAVTVAGQREVVREYSDTLLIFLLKANRPTKYRDRVDARVETDFGQALIRLLGRLAIDDVDGVALPAD
jgi:hypothetical protein